MREWIAPDLAAAWLVMIGATAVAETGQVALTLNFTLNLKPAANFAFTLNARLLFVVGVTAVAIAIAYGSARVNGRSTRKVSTDVDFSLLTLVMPAMLGCCR